MYTRLMYAYIYMYGHKMLFNLSDICLRLQQNNANLCSISLN